MANSKWTDSSVEGRGLRRVFKKLIGKIEQEENPETLVKLANAAAYVADKKVSIAFKTELEERVQRLEQLAGITKTRAEPN